MSNGHSKLAKNITTGDRLIGKNGNAVKAYNIERKEDTSMELKMVYRADLTVSLGYQLPLKFKKNIAKRNVKATTRQ
jgi:hypothetical protein